MKTRSRYDGLGTQLLIGLDAEAVVVGVINGTFGTGLTTQFKVCPEISRNVAALAKALREMADDLEAQAAAGLAPPNVGGN